MSTPTIIGASVSDQRGVNPLHFMGVFNDGENWYLVQRQDGRQTANGPELQWDWYSSGYTKPVKRPLYVPDVAKTVMPLSVYTDRYDFMQSGSTNIGHWFDNAAKKAGR